MADGVVRLNFGQGVNGCNDDWCVSDPGEGHGNAHVDATGHVYGRACIKCGTDLTNRMAVYVFVSHVRDGRRYCWSVPAEDVLCINCGNNGANTLTWQRYRQLKGVALLPEVPAVPVHAVVTGCWPRGWLVVG